MIKVANHIVSGMATKKLIFTKEDIDEVSDSLTKLLRTIFVKRKVTYGDLYQALYKENNRIGLSINKINENWGNLKSTILSKTLTSKRVNYIFTILGWKVEEVNFKIVTYNEKNEPEVSEDYCIKF
jgi:hypothetical protein